MPNWCENKLKVNISASTTPVSKLIKAALKDEGDPKMRFRFMNLVPLPGWVWDYDEANKHWWTKWDIDVPQQDIVYSNIDWDQWMHLSFDTAWAPPIQFYHEMVKAWYVFEAYYFEPGCSIIWYYLSDVWCETDGDNDVEYDENKDTYITNDISNHDTLNELWIDHIYGKV